MSLAFKKKRDLNKKFLHSFFKYVCSIHMYCNIILFFNLVCFDLVRTLAVLSVLGPKIKNEKSLKSAAM